MFGGEAALFITIPPFTVHDVARIGALNEHEGPSPLTYCARNTSYALLSNTFKVRYPSTLFTNPDPMFPAYVLPIVIPVHIIGQIKIELAQ